jgi:hypothetical protein
MSIPDNSMINDIRTPSQFKGISFSKYKKTDVRNQLIKNMINGKIEPASYWAVELICAGHYMELWETILHYVGKHIHLGNPKLVIYLEMRYTIFRNIMAQGHYLSELELRNNDKIRKLFAEVISMLTLSNKKHSFESIKINRVEEFDMTQMTERLKAPHVRYIEGIFQKEDPKELYVAMNEFAYNLSIERSNMMTACYWIEWVIEFDIICRKRKEDCLCQRRTSIPVETKYQRDIIWLIWDCLLKYSDEKKNPFIDKIMKSIMYLFCIKYTTGACKRRRYLLYYAVALLTEPVPTNVEIVSRKEFVQNVVEKINELYKQIKKNEESPNTEYLFSNLDQKNTFEESMRRMEMLQSVDFANGQL